MKCAISECENEAIANVEHDNNPFSIPLCKEHLKPYTNGFESCFTVKYY